MLNIHTITLLASKAGRRVALLAGAVAISAAVLLGMSGSAIAAGPCEYADTPVDWLWQDDAEATVLCLVNQERSAAGLRELTQNDTLAEAARGHAYDAVDIKWWYDSNPHVNPYTGSTPSDRITSAGYCPNPISWANGENTYWGYSVGDEATAPTPRDAVSWWMNSPGHRANILNPNYTELGNGVVLDTAADVYADAAATFVQNFGTCTN